MNGLGVVVDCPPLFPLLGPLGGSPHRIPPKPPFPVSKPQAEDEIERWGITKEIPNKRNARNTTIPFIEVYFTCNGTEMKEDSVDRTVYKTHAEDFASN
jgi:hypothetical protein